MGRRYICVCVCLSLTIAAQRKMKILYDSRENFDQEGVIKDKGSIHIRVSHSAQKSQTSSTLCFDEDNYYVHLSKDEKKYHEAIWLWLSFQYYYIYFVHFLCIFPFFLIMSKGEKDVILYACVFPFLKILRYKESFKISKSK